MNAPGKTITIFVGLAVVSGVLILVANNTTSTPNQLLLISLGSAIFGSGLTFFLIRFIGLDDRK